MNQKKVQNLFQAHFGMRPKSQEIMNLFEDVDFFNLLKSQKFADETKSKIGKLSFEYGLDIYFSQFLNSDKSIDWLLLKTDMEENLATYVRHLGSLRCDFLNILIHLSENLTVGFLDNERLHS